MMCKLINAVGAIGCGLYGIATGSTHILLIGIWFLVITMSLCQDDKIDHLEKLIKEMKK